MDAPDTAAAFRPATFGEAAAVVGICFGLFIVWSVSAAADGFSVTGGFSDAAFASTIALELLLGGTALAMLRWRGHVLAQLLPMPDWRGTGLGVLLCIACLAAWVVVSTTLVDTRDYAAQPIARMVAMSRPSLAMVVLASAINGVYEETFLVGYLVRGFSALGAPLALGISTLVRLLYHVYQGPVGALSVVVFGLVVGLFYWQTRRLWPVAVAHALQDVVAFSYSG